jgi:transcriptional regulator with XRE-family HTH domain
VGRTPERFEVAVEFGQRVRDRRHELEWSIEQLAERAGLHWTYVGSVERGERNLSLVNICRLAAALDVDAGEVMADLETRV